MGLGSDSALDTIVHSGLHAALPKFYPTTLEIQAATVTRRPNGEQEATWATVIVVRANVAKTSRVLVETRTGEMTRVPAGWVANLDGCYEDVTVEHRAYFDNSAWNIAAVAHDSLGRSTRLELERVEH
jgi:hypothetical protein